MNNDQDQEYWLRCGIPAQLVNATLDNWDCETQEQRIAGATMDDFCHGKGNFALIFGLYGLGKSHLGAAAIREVGSGVFITTATLLSLHRSLPFDGYGCTKSKLIETLKDCKMLVLDELGVSSGGRDENALLDDVLSHRYDRQKPTVLIANLPIGKIRELLGERIADRVRENCLKIEMTGKSRRTPSESPRKEFRSNACFTGLLPDSDEGMFSSR